MKHNLMNHRKNLKNNFITRCIEATYHPGIFEKGCSGLRWSCCGGLASDGKGCSNTYFHEDEVRN